MQVTRTQNSPEPLLYKPDFPRAAASMDRWWRGEDLGRPPLALCGLKREPRRVAPPASLEDRWFNIDGKLDAAEAVFEATDYLAEWVPNYCYDLGSSLDAGFLGARYTLAEDTVWWEPFVEDWGKTPPFVFDEQNPLFRRVHGMMERACERARGKYLVSMPTMGGPLDILAAVRGTDRLLFDLVDQPEEIRKRLDELAVFYIAVLRKFWNLTAGAGVGGTHWWPTYGRTTSLVAQNDFSIMISPEMFREIVLPSLERVTQAFPNCIYHLDGPGALVHVKALATVPNIRAIMFCEGSGNDPIMRWFDALREIQKTGKSVAQGFPAGAERQMLSNLDRRKMLLLCATGLEHDIHRVLDNIVQYCEKHPDS
jgi:hypothetical protein